MHHVLPSVVQLASLARPGQHARRALRSMQQRKYVLASLWAPASPALPALSLEGG